MYALIGCTKDGGEPVLLNTAHTLKAAQRKMDIILGMMWMTTWKQPSTAPCYKFLGFLTEVGLVNYDGERISKSTLGSVTLKMEIEREAL